MKILRQTESYAFIKSQYTWKIMLHRAKEKKPSADVVMRFYFRGDSGPG